MIYEKLIDSNGHIILKKELQALFETQIEWSYYLNAVFESQ